MRRKQAWSNHSLLLGKGWNELVNGAVEVNAAVFLELEERHPRERLRDTDNLEPGVGRNRHVVLKITEPILECHHQFAVVQNRGLRANPFERAGVDRIRRP